MLRLAKRAGKPLLRRDAIPSVASLLSSLERLGIARCGAFATPWATHWAQTGPSMSIESTQGAWG